MPSFSEEEALRQHGSQPKKVRSINREVERIATASMPLL
jgi:hypothetical protein